VLTAESVRLALPLFAMIPFGVATRDAYISDRDFERSAVYNEISRPLGGFHALHLRRNGASGTFLLSVCRPQRAGNFDATDADTLRMIAPHLDAAVKLQTRLQGAEQGHAGLVRTLDRLADGLILTDVASRPIHANARALRIAAEADGLVLDHAGLAAGSPAATRELREAVASVSHDLAVEGRRIRLERPSHRPPLLLTVLPIWRLGIDVPAVGTARAAVFITEPDVPPALDRAAIAEAFRLTRRESEVAVLLADGLDLETIAARLGLSRGTVRDHLKHVFDKTGARSQVALVALLRGFIDRLQ
jgi:DNA-binding CsgD family transcriptional regulator